MSNENFSKSSETGQTADLFGSSAELPSTFGESQQLQGRIEALQAWHRELSEQIVECNRALSKLAAAVGPDGLNTSAELQNLKQQRDELQGRRMHTEGELASTLKSLKSMSRKSATTQAAGVDHLQSEVELSPQEKGLIRQRHPNRDFFLADLFDYALKDDGASMEAPIFTLSTKPDLSIWQWSSKDGSKSVKVAPSVLGRATQHDKDVLIYVVSQLTEALNRGRDDAKNRTVRFTVYDFLVSTNRGVGGDDYTRLQSAFERLAGTRITTDIRTGGERVKQGFGLIDEWRIIEKSHQDERMIAVEVTLSRWLHNAVQAFEVLTIHPDYFRLRKPLARRLYELARKHCGHQTQWAIGLTLLQEKTGSKSSLREFRRAIRAIEEDDSLPEYRFILNEDDKVIFYIRQSSRLVAGLTKKMS